jgi:hypothetical protein
MSELPGKLFAGVYGRLLKEDARSGVAEQSGGDFVGGGAVRGLRAQIGEPVADEDVAEPPMAAELQPGLQVLDGPLVLQ